MQLTSRVLTSCSRVERQEAGRKDNGIRWYRVWNFSVADGIQQREGNIETRKVGGIKEKYETKL